MVRVPALVLMFASLLSTTVFTQPVPVIGESDSHIRFVDSRLELILGDGMRRSPTLRRLVAQVEASDVIVYFETKQTLKGGLLGSITWIGATDDSRFLRATFKARPRSNLLIATIGHELQHVAEVAEAPWVRSSLLLRALYNQVGARTGSSDSVWDSEAARNTGEQVLRELNRVVRTDTAEATADER